MSMARISLRSALSAVSARSARAMPAAALQHRTFKQKPVAAQETPMEETVRYFLGPDQFYDELTKNEMDFFTGVPDSLLKDFCSYVTDNSATDKHVQTANEGAAIATAAGYHLATGKYPVVYMQNSGFGNCVNPLLSLTDAGVYNIPMLMLIGWRGEPGKKDEPQHKIQGAVMPALLTDLGIKFEILPDYEEGAQEAIAAARHHFETRGTPYALLVKRQTFSKYALQSKDADQYTINREQALELVVNNTDPNDAFVSTTGFASRELYEIREKLGQDHSREFLTVGSMGHAPAIALGIALAQPERQVMTLDGDGAALMHMGTMATVATSKAKNFKHILFNNGAHDSVGGQTTGAYDHDFVKVANGLGYKSSNSVSEPDEIEAALKELRAIEGPAFLEIRVNKGARSDLGRPKSTPVENKADFMNFLSERLE